MRKDIFNAIVQSKEDILSAELLIADQLVEFFEDELSWDKSGPEREKSWVYNNSVLKRKISVRIFDGQEKKSGFLELKFSDSKKQSETTDTDYITFAGKQIDQIKDMVLTSVTNFL